jgi:hypothetical protein
MLAETKQNTLIAIILITGMVVFVHKPGLQGHQISHPLYTSCRGAYEGYCLPAKITDKRRTTAMSNEFCLPHKGK